MEEVKGVIGGNIEVKEEEERVERERRNAGRGSILGAFIGDATGAYLEFSKFVLDKERIDLAMTMPGGGVHKVGPGQVTDDSELAISLAHGLVHGKGILDIASICQYYANWIKSCPFDIGNTTRNSLFTAKSGPYLVRKKAYERNQISQSNGSLMRCTPLAVWLMKMEDPYKNIAVAVREEVQLTHPNRLVQEAEICYCLAIYYLINHSNEENKRQMAYDYAKNWAKEYGSEEIQEWFIVAETQEMETGKKQGWVKIAWTYSFKYLLNEENYFSTIRTIISKGGDTDTNAAIVGGLIGAAVGLEEIPLEMRKKVLEWDPKDIKKPSKSMKRPQFLIPKHHLMQLIDQILDMAPTSLNIKNGSSEDKPYKK